MPTGSEHMSREVAGVHRNAHVILSVADVLLLHAWGTRKLKIIIHFGKLKLNYVGT